MMGDVWAALTDPRQLVGYGLSVNTVAVMWLAGSKRVLGWWLALAGQAGWLTFCILFDAWGLLPLVAALSFVYTRNLLRWRRHEATARRIAEMPGWEPCDVYTRTRLPYQCGHLQHRESGVGAWEGLTMGRSA